MFRGQLRRQPLEKPVHAVPKAYSRHLSPSFVCVRHFGSSYPFRPMRVLRFMPMVGVMDWLHLFAICVLCWLAVALAVGTIVGHGIALGTSGDPD
jgi:hypothetical protein